MGLPILCPRLLSRPAWAAAGRVTQFRTGPAAAPATPRHWHSSSLVYAAWLLVYASAAELALRSPTDYSTSYRNADYNKLNPPEV